MRREIALGVACVFAASAVLAQTSAPGKLRDLWIHPRGEPFQPELHYKARDGELFYHVENDIKGGLSDFAVEGLRPLRISIGIGKQLFARAAVAGGSVRPVFLWDSDGDGKIDRSLRGRIEADRAIFEAPLELDLAQTRWQIGLRLVAGTGGDKSLDRRYLASVESSAIPARLKQSTPPVAAAPSPGLWIAKRSATTAFDFDAFLSDPDRHTGEFTPLTKAADSDDWTIAEDEGRLLTHFAEDDLFIVRAIGGAALEVRWGDLPLERYLTQNLRARADASGCYNTRDVALTGEDGTPASVPQKILYCPKRAFAFFELPDGYEVDLAAVSGAAEQHDRTEAGTSTRDNLRLYAKEVNPRSASKRATGSVGGNLRASFADAGADLVDLGRHAVVGETRTHQHEGTSAYRVSPLTALPFALYDLARLQPARAAGRIVTGVESGVQTVADLTSAANNAVVVPLAQLTVGAAASPRAADRVGDAAGVATATVARNLPASERTLDAWNPLSVPRHDRGYAPSAYTRTDAQLNIDRLISILDGVALGAVLHHNRGGSDGGGGSGGVSGAVGGGKAPPRPLPKPCRRLGA